MTASLYCGIETAEHKGEGRGVGAREDTRVGAPRVGASDPEGCVVVGAMRRRVVVVG